MDAPAGAPSEVTVRYWAAARAAAGCVEEQVPATTVAEALEAVRQRHDDEPRFARVLGVSSLLLGDRPVGVRDPAEVPVASGDVIEVLPPFAGG